MGLRGRRNLIEKLKHRHDQFVRALALETLSRVIKRTPVDTGAARANWNVALDRPDRSNDPDSTNAAEAVQKGQAVIMRTGVGDRIFITNSLPYIGELEDGNSKQAPQGMVKITAAEMTQLASRIAAKIAHEGGT